METTKRTATVRELGGSFYLISADGTLTIAGPYKTRRIAERQARFYGYETGGNGK